MIVYYEDQPYLLKSPLYNNEETTEEFLKAFPNHEVILMSNQFKEVKAQAYQIRFKRED